MDLSKNGKVQGKRKPGEGCSEAEKIMRSVLFFSSFILAFSRSLLAFLLIAKCE
jgi:hypothetical protein